MPLYNYRARDAQGALITGRIDAPAADVLKMRLADQGLIPLAVRRAAANLRLPTSQELFARKVKGDELLIFTRQFQTLFKAGLAMDSIFSALIRQSQSSTLRDTLSKIRAEVSAGGSLSKAFSKHPKVFRDLYVNMLAAGEEAGILDETLKNLSDLLEKENSLNASIKSATLYPKIVVGVLILATSILMAFVVPKFQAFYANFKATLPLPTLILIRISNFVVHDWYIVLVVVGAILFLYSRFKRTARGKLKVGEVKFRIPVFGPLQLRVANARFCHILAALYRSGLSITRALEITGGTIENAAFQRDVDLLKTELTKGRSLSEAMNLCRYFTPVIVEATAAGEKAGSLDEMLEGVGGHYDMEVQHIVKNLTTMLEPFLLVLLFGMITLFALAIFLPIWNLTSVVF